MPCDNVEMPPHQYRNRTVPHHIVRYVSQHELRRLSGMSVSLCGWTDTGARPQVIYIDVRERGNRRLLKHEQAHVNGWRHDNGLAALLKHL